MSSTCLGRCCTRLSDCHPSAMPFPRPASVVTRWRPWTTCFSHVLYLTACFPGCPLCSFFIRRHLGLSFSVMFVLASPRMSFCVSVVSLSMLLMSANSLSGWPGIISGFVTCSRVPLLSWSGLNLVFVSICLCYSAVSSLLAVSGILLDSGVPMVLLARSVMVVWFYRSSFIVLAVLVFSFLL